MKHPKIRILVADDHLIVRDGIISIVEVEKDMRVVAQASDGVEAVSLVKKHLPDIVLLDLRMPRLDGLEVIAQIQSLHVPSKVIVLTTFESEQDVHLALKAGARSYLLKDIPRSTLLAFGLPMNDERSLAPLQAEILVGEDGAAHAIRFINDQR